MADKEATVYIIDVGKSMGEKSNGRNETNFEYAMRYIWDRITTTVATGRKQFLASVVTVKSDETNNDLDDDESYAHINVVQRLQQIQMPELRKLQLVLRPSNTTEGDPISALAIAVQMILEVCKQLKYNRKIVIVTDGTGNMDTDNLGQITKKIKEMGMELMVLGVDFDDEEFGFKEESKPGQKAHNEKILSSMVEDCHGVYGTLEAAIQELSSPRINVPRPVPSFRGQLRLGDPEQYDSAMTIDVERYSRVMIAKAPTASAFVNKANFSQDAGQSSKDLDEAGGADGGGVTVVRNEYCYFVKDEDDPLGKKQVLREELAKGYEYGRTVVHISESDQNITKLETEAALDLMGFVPKEKYERYMGLGQTYIIIAQKTNDKAILALSSFIHALFELETNAIARLVTKDGRDPQIVLLSPEVTPDYECLVETQLPFAEDVRSYQFPPLDKVITVSGKVLAEHRNLPNDKLLQAMSDYVDAMALSNFGEDDDGNNTEYMKIEDTFSPLLHRLDAEIRSRAIDPKSHIGQPASILTKYSKPPDELVSQSQTVINNLITLSDVKKVPPRVKGRKRTRESDKPLSGLDVDDLFRRGDNAVAKRKKLSSENPIPEYIQLLKNTSDPKDIQSYSSQFQNIIEDRIRSSFGDQYYERVIEEIGAMRDELRDYEEPQIWNDIIRDLKEKILGGTLGGDRRELWWSIRKRKLGLIHEGTPDVNKELAGVASEEAAKQFWKELT